MGKGKEWEEWEEGKGHTVHTLMSSCNSGTF
jgi:hypothetical protein